MVVVEAVEAGQVVVIKWLYGCSSGSAIVIVSSSSAIIYSSKQ